MIMVGLAIAMLFIVCALWSVNLTYRQIMQAIYPLTNIAQIVSEQKLITFVFLITELKSFKI